MTPRKDCPAAPGMIPRDCSEAFGDIRERVVRIEMVLQEVRNHQKSSIRKMWELGKAAALLVIGAATAWIKLKMK